MKLEDIKIPESNLTKSEFINYMKDCKFYRLQKEHYFRITHKKSKEITKFPVLNEYWEKVDMEKYGQGFGWMQYKHFSTLVKCVDGVVEIECSGEDSIKYKIKEI